MQGHFQFAGIEGQACSEFHQLCQLNQRYPFVNFTRENGQSWLQLAYPADDLNDGERELLEGWFVYVVSLAE